MSASLSHNGQLPANSASSDTTSDSALKNILRKPPHLRTDFENWCVESTIQKPLMAMINSAFESLDPREQLQIVSEMLSTLREALAGNANLTPSQMGELTITEYELEAYKNGLVSTCTLDKGFTVREERVRLGQSVGVELQ